MRRISLAFMLSLAIGCLWAASAQAVVLKDQTSNIEFNGSIYSDDFARPTQPGPAIPDYQVADDFTVPAGEAWTITQFQARGFFNDSAEQGPLPSALNVWIYADNGSGLPGAQLFFQANASAINAPDYDVTLSGVPKLQPGNYWISVQQPDAFAGNCEGPCETDWKWRLFQGTSGNHAVVMTSDCTAGVWVDVSCAPSTFASTRATTSGGNTLFNLLGNTGPAAATAACLSVSADARNFHPRVPKTPTVLGVRAKFNASAPAQLAIAARLKVNGKITDLGNFSRSVGKGVSKLRIPLPPSLRGKLPHGKKVVLLLHIAATPKGSTACAASVKDLKLKTRIINVRRSALKNP
ncbi:MAG: hypothetical protein QOH29_2062 [Actinomycetota bacterium]|nr:hypothetical protein [Actinomycetota bacterium]